MEQCWDANPLKRPDVNTLLDKIREINTLHINQNKFQLGTNNNFEVNRIRNLERSYTSSSTLFTSKVHEFEIYLNQEMQQKVLLKLL
jgi:hypothetical protein